MNTHAESALTPTIKKIYRESCLDVTDVRGLLGLLLVDGSLVHYRSPSGGYIQMTITAGVKESAYLEEKVAEFKSFFPTRAAIAPYSTAKRANGKQTTVLRFRASTNKLRPVFNLLYPGGERQITQPVLDILGAQAAAWCWAESAVIGKRGGARLSRVGNTRAEAMRLNTWLELLTGARGEVKVHRKRPRLSFDPQQTKKVQAALIQYAPKSRIHLFTGEVPDVSAIRSSRTELLLGSGDTGIARAEAETLVGNHSA